VLKDIKNKKVIPIKIIIKNVFGGFFSALPAMCQENCMGNSWFLDSASF